MSESLLTLLANYDFNAPQCVVVSGFVSRENLIGMRLTRRYALHVVAARPVSLHVHYGNDTLTLERKFTPFVWLTPTRRLVRRDNEGRLVFTTFDDLVAQLSNEDEERWLSIGLRQDFAAMLEEVQDLRTPHAVR